MATKRILYHATAPENVDSILRNGLIPGGGVRTAWAVYLSTKPKSWYQDGLVILKVNVSGLESIPATTFLPESDEVLFWGVIPRERVTIFQK
jgi:RNA:NAD 2'-phosphotransferase (TPT1/KptA family)